MNRCIIFKNNAGLNLAINEYKEGIDIEIEGANHFLYYSLSNNEKEKLIEFLLNKETNND